MALTRTTSPQAPPTTAVLSVSVALPVPDMLINGILQHVVLCVWLLPPGVLFSSSSVPCCGGDQNSVPWRCREYPQKAAHMFFSLHGAPQRPRVLQRPQQMGCPCLGAATGPRSWLGFLHWGSWWEVGSRQGHS